MPAVDPYNKPRRASGKIVYLRVHDVGTKYGPPGHEELDTEVIVKLNTEPNRAYGFQLRNDKHLHAHQGMLQLLLEAFRSNLTVQIDYYGWAGPGIGGSPRNNNPIFRVWLEKP